MAFRCVAVAKPTVAAPAAAARKPATPAVVDRRALLGLAATAFTLATARAASAIEIPSQASTGSTVRRGSIPPSSSGASMSGYTMEGTKKRGLSPAAKKKAMGKAKEAILAGNK